MEETVNETGYYGVDLDGTLAHFDEDVPYDPEKIGEPIPVILESIKDAITNGQEIRIVTARVNLPDEQERAEMVTRIQDWCEANGLPRLEVQAHKDYGMIRLYDDRVVEVFRNKGIGWREVIGTICDPLTDGRCEEWKLRNLIMEIDKMGMYGHYAAGMLRQIVALSRSVK